MMVHTLPTGISITSEEWDAICYTNREHIKHGKYPVFAVDFVQNMAVLCTADLTLSYSHTRPDGRTSFTAFDDLGYSYGSVSENIGKNMGAERMVEGWMSSIQGHRENLLNGKWTYIGLGYCPADDLHIKRSYFKGKVAGALAIYLNGATVTECSVADDVAGTRHMPRL